MFFYKHLKSIIVPENIFLDEIKSLDKNIWFTAKNTGNYKLDFVKDKPQASFYLARIKKFPKILKFVQETFPEAIIPNSYITKCDPGYSMEKHIDAGRETAIIIPLGENKGIINFYIKDFLISKCRYKGPTLSRVDVVHSAVNISDQTRYSLTIEIKGSYWENYFNYH